MSRRILKATIGVIAAATSIAAIAPGTASAAQHPSSTSPTTSTYVVRVIDGGYESASFTSRWT
jgi:hypothetical protein